MPELDSSARFTQLATLPGHFHFADVHTTDVEAAKAFYADLFGWTYQEIPGAPNRYVMASIDDRGKTAITGLTDEQRAADASSYWLPYLWVEDIEASYAKVAELGGTCLYEPVEVFDYGFMALVQDSTGAMLGLWQDKRQDTTVKDEAGSPFWYELHTTDVDAALEFYAGLVGWSTDPQQMGPNMTYHLIVPEQVDEHQRNAGGIMQQMQQDTDAGAPSQWYAYFNVDDCDAAFERAQELGATPVMEPHDIPGAGRSCWVADPQGAYLALMKPTPPEN